MAREIPIFNRQLIEYLPPVMRDAAEMQQIMAAEQPEVAELWERLQWVLDQQFIDSADDYGISRWEKILRITPGKGDTLDERKERILLILRMKLPYTIRWLRQWLADNVGGEDKASVAIDRYTIEIWLHYDRIDKRIFLDVLDLLGWVRPSNMVLGITGQIERSCSVSLAGYSEQCVDLEIGAAQHQSNGVLMIGGYAEIQQTIII